jgi:NADPH-dependent glutamate synthase beta subunit-like oxidoreductase/NAD(P)H-flavin reductase
MTKPLQFSQFTIAQLHQAKTIEQLDNAFLSQLEENDPALFKDFVRYRNQDKTLANVARSEVIIAAGKHLDVFLADFFAITEANERLQRDTLSSRPVFAFKKWYVQRRAKRRLMRDEELASFAELDAWLTTQIDTSKDREIAIAEFALPFLDDAEANEAIIERITQWCIQAVKTAEGRTATKGWPSFKLPNRTDYKKLIPIQPVAGDPLGRDSLSDDQLRPRDGFGLTDKRMSRKQVMSEIDYCVYCHDHDGDFCSIGFPEKKGDPEKGYRTNGLGNTLTGCPLDEKISEMNSLKRDGFGIAALATVMIDNPMCPATGHRICNDCMKGCIYQKQDPVNVPEIETRVLTDVINLPWGVEIYDLLTYWNPLRNKQYQAKPYNGLKHFIAGMGPAGFTLAHHMLMEGFAVVGTDGLKIEPLDKALLDEPIKNFSDIEEDLNTRRMAGFGGVAEYGITVRWDKNFLKLIYISLMRRPHFQVFGGVRFGGTVTVEELWQLGFDHATVAVGAGLPKALPIPGSMAKGMRQANDFLMALQLTGAAKPKSIANLQIRLPAVVIGGGLTGVDTATELQAYYISQVEKTAKRYHKLCESQGMESVRANYDEEGLIILDEFLQHAELVKQERELAAKENRAVNFIPLIRSWGGVSIVYRRSMQESPAYISNHEELAKALEEGLYYLGGLQPAEAKLDEFGSVSKLLCTKRIQDEEGNWENTDSVVELEAKSILVATGAQPNVAYSFEHYGTFKRNRLQYQSFNVVDDEMHEAEIVDNIKDKAFGPFTSYQDEDRRRVTFLGDTHPVFHGNVVRAIASAYRSYPRIVESFGERALQLVDENEYAAFKEFMNETFNCSVVAVERRADNIVELTVKAPQAVKRFKPGQFFRVQNYEFNAEIIEDTRLQTEPTALAGFYPDRENGTMKLMVIERGASSQLYGRLKAGDPIAFMGPTGVRSKITQDKQTILIMGDTQQCLAYVRAVGPDLLEAGNKVIFFGCFEAEGDFYCEDEIAACTNQIFSFVTGPNDPAQEQFNASNDPMTCFIKLVKDGELDLQHVDRITILGNTGFLQSLQAARHGILQNDFKEGVKIYGAIHSSMQCMLKGVCAQCLQWQVDPETGKRNKAVFACSWQDQPLELVDLPNLDERLGQNRMAETTADLWLGEILEE